MAATAPSQPLLPGRNRVTSTITKPAKSKPLSRDSRHKRTPVSQALISTANAYRLLTFHGSLWNPADYIRIYTIPQNCKVFLWLAFRDRLNTKANMVNKKWSNDPHCPIYPALESADHIILRCRNANNLWKRLGHAFGQKI